MEKDPAVRYASAAEFAAALTTGAAPAGVATSPRAAVPATSTAQPAGSNYTESPAGTTTIAVRFSEIMKGLTGSYTAVDLQGAPRKSWLPLVIAGVIAAAAIAVGVWFAMH